MLTEQQRSVLHRAGIGGYRPMGDASGPVVERANDLVERGYLAVNEGTGIYFLTPEGHEALTRG